MLTFGLFILLPKKGDQMFLGNKHGLTLLNCALKILTKIYQLRLSKVMQGFIIEYQNAFLPGCSIHRLIMLMNKVLHKAKLTS